VLLMVGLFSIVVGSFGAINQTKIKRLLAYSAIGHVGFMVIGLGLGTFESVHSTIIYFILYVIMTTTTFTVIITQGIEKIASLRGWARRNGVLAITLGLSMMSIAGIPPLAGFYSKYLIILSAVEANQIAVAITAIVLSVISCFYYVRLIQYIYFIDKAEVSVVTYPISLTSAIVLGITIFVTTTILFYPSLLLAITVPSIY
jgi:NADH-quinone oxidoreductase subunit N